jgi:hypothetical protein
MRPTAASSASTRRFDQAVLGARIHGLRIADVARPGQARR